MIKRFILYLITLIAIACCTSCTAVLDTPVTSPPPGHVYVYGPSRYYYPSGHPMPYYRRPVPPPKPQGPRPGGGNRPPQNRGGRR